jgi:ribokinase
VNRPKILVVGSSNTDLILQVPRIPRPGETLIGGAFATAAGGKGANQAVAAARAGGEVTFIARVGTDSFGDQAVAGFANDRIATRFIVRDQQQPSGVALIFVAANGQNSIAVASGANGCLAPADVNRAQAAFARADLMVAQLETPLETVTAAVRLAARHNLPVILNPAPARPLPQSLLRHIFVLTPNENESELLTGIKITSDAAAARASKKLRSLGVKSVILTLGARGAFVSDAGGERRIPGFKVKAVDTTAAGDVFSGALAVALAEGRDLDRAVRFAGAAAALSVTRLGAQTSAPSRSAIETLLAQKSQGARSR